MDASCHGAVANRGGWVCGELGESKLLRHGVSITHLCGLNTKCGILCIIFFVKTLVQPCFEKLKREEEEQERGCYLAASAVSLS